MRLPKFRIKNKKNNWVVFTVLHNGIDTDNFIRETLGQYTGLRDKNKKPIYEGDIIGYLDSDGKDSIIVVTFKDGGFYPFAPDYLSLSISEVVGNIHENGDLL